MIVIANTLTMAIAPQAALSRSLPIVPVARSIMRRVIVTELD
jgi:hypothetical protein